MQLILKKTIFNKKRRTKLVQFIDNVLQYLARKLDQINQLQKR